MGDFIISRGYHPLLGFIYIIIAKLPDTSINQSTLDYEYFIIFGNKSDNIKVDYLYMKYDKEIPKLFRIMGYPKNMTLDKYGYEHSLDFAKNKVLPKFPEFRDFRLKSALRGTAWHRFIIPVSRLLQLQALAMPEYS